MKPTNLQQLRQNVGVKKLSLSPIARVGEGPKPVNSLFPDKCTEHIPNKQHNHTINYRKNGQNVGWKKDNKKGSSLIYRIVDSCVKISFLFCPGVSQDEIYILLYGSIYRVISIKNNIVQLLNLDTKKPACISDTMLVKHIEVVNMLDEKNTLFNIQNS